MKGYRGYPVKIRGVVYINSIAAAKAIGVRPSTIYSAINNGTTDYVGLGANYRRKRKVKYKGEIYESIADFARKMGVKESLMYARIRLARDIRGENYLYKGHPVEIIT